MKQLNKLHRIYLETKIEVNKNIPINQILTHRLNKVLRIKKNENIILFNGNGEEYICEVILDKKKYLKPITRNRKINKNLQQIILAQSITASKVMELSIQKAVELGVESIIPIISERSHEGDYQKKIDRWKQIIVHAVEQSAGLFIPNIDKIIYLDRFLEEHKEVKNYKILYDPHGRKMNKTDINHKKYTILIGPEGGFTENEIKNSIKKNWNIISLGDRILRTETASIVGHALIKRF